MTAPSADRPFRRRVLVNTAAVGASNLWSMVLGLVSLPLLLTGLGAEAFGTWVLLQTFSAVNGWFSLLDLGMATAGTREVAARHGVEDEAGLGLAVGTTIRSLAVLGLVSGVVFSSVGPVVLPPIFGVSADLEDALHTAIVVFGLQLALDLIATGYLAVLDGYQRIDRARGVDVARRTLVTVAIVVAALVWEDLAAVAVASAAATAVGTATAAVAVRGTARGLTRRSSVAAARELFRYGRTVAVLRPLGVLHRTVDRVVVGIVLGPSAVSLVEVATQVQNGADSILAASSYTVVPSAARLESQQEPAKLVELLERGTRLSLLATWPLTALAAVLAGPLVAVWVGSDYQDAAGLVALASVALAILAPAQVGSNLLLGTGRAGTILRVATAAIVVNVAASVALVQVVGIAGAFQATILASLITAPLLIRAVLASLTLAPRPFARTAIAPAVPAPLAAIAGAGLAVALPLGPWPTLVLGGTLGAVGAASAAYRWGLERDEAAAALTAVRRALRRPSAASGG